MPNPSSPKASSELVTFPDGTQATIQLEGPQDTTDPRVKVSTVPPDAATAKQNGHPTVNGAVETYRPTAADPEGFTGRTETYGTLDADGNVVTVEHCLETGATRVL